MEIVCGVVSKPNRSVFFPSTISTSLSTLSTVTLTTLEASVDVNVTVFPAAKVPDMPLNLILVLPSYAKPALLSNVWKHY